MWRATLKGLLAHKVRLGLTALAIVLGVGFVSGTSLLTDTMNRAFDNLFQQANAGVAVSVHAQAKFKGTGGGGLTAGPPQRIPAALLDSIRQVPGVRDAEGSLTGYAHSWARTARPSPPGARRRSACRGRRTPTSRGPTSGRAGRRAP